MTLPYQRQAPRREGVKGVTRLMHEGHHVVDQPDRVHEDEGATAPVERIAVSAWCLARPAVEVEQLLVDHDAELCAERRIHPVEHRPGTTSELRAVAERAQGLRPIEIDRQVPGAERVEPELFAAVRHEAPVRRHDMAFDGIVEALAVRRRIVEAKLRLEYVVAERYEAGVLRHLLPQAVHLIEQCGQLVAGRYVRCRARAEGALPDVPVRLLEEGGELRQRQLLPLPWRGHAAGDALVRSGVLLQLAHDRHVGVAKDLDGRPEAAQHGLQRRRHIARRDQPLLQRDAPFFRLRQDLHREPEVVLLGGLVARVDGVADHRPAGGLGEHRLEPRPVSEPRLHRIVVEVPRGERVEVGADVIPGCLGERLGRGDRYQGHTFSMFARACR